MTHIIPESEQLVFDMYFATIVGMNNHPGNIKEPVQKKTLIECARQALQMLEIRRTVLNEEYHNA